MNSKKVRKRENGDKIRNKGKHATQTTLQFDGMSGNQENILERKQVKARLRDIKGNAATQKNDPVGIRAERKGKEHYRNLKDGKTHYQSTEKQGKRAILVPIMSIIGTGAMTSALVSSRVLGYVEPREAENGRRFLNGMDRAKGVFIQGNMREVSDSVCSRAARKINENLKTGSRVSRSLDLIQRGALIRCTRGVGKVYGVCGSPPHVYIYPALCRYTAYFSATEGGV